MIRAFTTNAFTGFVSGTAAAGGVLLGSAMASYMPLSFLVKTVCQISGAVLGVAAGLRVMEKLRTDGGAVLAGIMFGYIAAMNPDNAAKVTIASLTTIGAIGAATRKW